MSSDREVSDNDSLTNLAKAVSLTDPRSSSPQQPSTIAHAPAFDQFSDKLFKSIQQCIDSALEPLVQRMGDIEKAMVIRTASIAEQVSTVSRNQQVLHQCLLKIMEKVDQLQFEEQSVYTDQESLSSFDIPAKRSARNADGVSVCSTEASDYQSNSDEEEDEDDDDDSVCTETAETLNQFQVPEAAPINAERYNQFTRIESRKYTAKFSNANQAILPPSSSSTDQVNTADASNNDKLMEQIKQITKEASQIIPGIPVVPLLTTTNATSTKSSITTTNSVPANSQTASSVAPKAPLPSTTSTLLKKESALTTAPVTKKAQPITIAPITVSIPTPTTPISAVQPPPPTTSIKASLEPASCTSDPTPTPTPSSMPVLQAEPKGNRSRSNQRRSRREPIAERFNYVYFEYVIVSRTKCNDVRAKLTGIGIPSKKMLDVYFPGKRVASVLFPEDYLDEAIDMLQKNQFTVLPDYNPLDPKNLGDPKYKHFSTEERNEILREFHEKQMCRAIDRIRGPTQSYVYEDFYKKGWISKERYTDYLLDWFRPLPERKPKN